MPISKEDDKIWCEQYHIILLAHIVPYWIWSLLDSSECLVVSWVSPPIFGLQQGCRFCKRMKLNMGGHWLNTLFVDYLLHHLYLFFLFFFLISIPSTVYISSFSILSFSIFSFSLCWSLLACLWCHKFQLHFMSVMPKIKGTLIKIPRFKMKPCQSQKKMTRVRGSNIT